MTLTGQKEKETLIFARQSIADTSSHLFQKGVVKLSHSRVTNKHHPVILLQELHITHASPGISERETQLSGSIYSSTDETELRHNSYTRYFKNCTSRTFIFTIKFKQ